MRMLPGLSCICPLARCWSRLVAKQVTEKPPSPPVRTSLRPRISKNCLTTDRITGIMGNCSFHVWNVSLAINPLLLSKDISTRSPVSRSTNFRIGTRAWVTHSIESGTAILVLSRKPEIAYIFSFLSPNERTPVRLKLSDSSTRSISAVGR
jgi:hypothetical protein